MDTQAYRHDGADRGGSVSAKQKEGQREFLEAKLHKSSKQSAELWNDSGVKMKVKSSALRRCVLGTMYTVLEKAGVCVCPQVYCSHLERVNPSSESIFFSFVQLQHIKHPVNNKSPL